MTLNVQVLSGLGSRMRAVIAAVAWAVPRNLSVCVHWPFQEPSETSGLFPIPFHDLFDSPLDCILLEGPRLSDPWKKTPTHHNGHWYCRTCSPESFEGMDLSGWPYRDYWRPSPRVRRCIDDVPWPTGKVVGVHIRNALAQPTTPPITYFLERMRDIQAEFGPVRFFLSTDALEVEEAVKAEFPGTFCQERTYRYDDLGIARAAADLFLLERCHWMVGSYNSSFSELAGWLRGGLYLPGWGRIGWMPGGRYEDLHTPAVGIEEALS